MPWASNYTFLARLPADVLVVYKPQRGETPLWDFPRGSLAGRETAAYQLCAAAGWTFVPPTILRDGPHGPGAVQQFIDHDPEITAFDLLEDHSADIRRIALFDAVANNADRKAGHVFSDSTGRVWAVDHGICFHADYKLRTVLWDFAGMEIAPEEHAALRRAAEGLGALNQCIDPDEVDAVGERIATLLATGVFPHPGPGRPIPWPPV